MEFCHILISYFGAKKILSRVFLENFPEQSKCSSKKKKMLRCLIRDSLVIDVILLTNLIFLTSKLEVPILNTK